MVFGYTGEVEGGDFKYMALRNAHRAGVTGSIASAAHGFAELCVQGTSEQIAHFRELLAHCIAHNHVECNLAETHEADVVINERTFLPNA
jgi:acylphosphatase